VGWLNDGAIQGLLLGSGGVLVWSLALYVATYVLVDTRGHLLDRVLYAPLLSRLRGQLRELSNRVVRQPDELTALADVRETVDQILRERSDDSPPLRVLVEAPGSSVIGGWLHYLVLKEVYVDGRPNKQIMQRYALSEGTFHRAIDAIASDLASRAVMV